MYRSATTTTLEMLCDKLVFNMTGAEWQDWISPTIAYMMLCPHRPIAAD